MTDKTAFSEQEWTRVKRAPFVAGMAISLADPGGPIELAKETSATLKTVLKAAEEGGRGEFVGAVADEVTADAKAHHNPLHDFKPRGALAGNEILDESARSTGSSAKGDARGGGRLPAVVALTPRRRRRTPPRKAASSGSTRCA